MQVVSERDGSRLRRLARWLPERFRLGARGASFGFGARLSMALLLTFVAVNGVDYVLQRRNLENQQIAADAALSRADAKGLYNVGGPANIGTLDGEFSAFLGIVQGHPGVLSVILVDPRGIVMAAGDRSLVGTADSAGRIAATLKTGASYAGRDSNPTGDNQDFEFVAPVQIEGVRYAYEVTYSHSAYDAQLRQQQLLLALIGLIALLGGGAVFYLAGGRTLMRAHRMVLRRATRDGLTDLPNLRAFQDELPQAVAASERYGDLVVLALLDVDDFKLINDRHGHPHGDATLNQVATALHELRPGDRAFRIGGDEFALLLAHTDAQGAMTLTTRLCNKLADAGIKVSIGVSALRPGVQADTLRAEADVALYEAKRHGGSGTLLFADLREQLTVLTAEKKEAVRRLVEEGRMTTDYQPIWNIGTGTLLGVEALARPDRSYGLSGPAEAFDIAEQIGRVHQLDVVCVTSALRIAPELGPDAHLFINLSPSTLDLDADGDNWLLTAVEEAGLAPQQVVVEVTERFGGRVAPVIKALHRLRQQGFRVAVDDVGTGNSGLEILRKIDAEFVKLDRSIVTAAATEPAARAVLMAMATFARQTGAFVIAEGIEDQETLEFLRTIDDLPVDADPIIQGGQGYGLGRPAAHVSPELPDILHAGQLIA